VKIANSLAGIGLVVLGTRESGLGFTFFPTRASPANNLFKEV